jgi:hypothetical protein
MWPLWAGGGRAARLATCDSEQAGLRASAATNPVLPREHVAGAGVAPPGLGRGPRPARGGCRLQVAKWFGGPCCAGLNPASALATTTTKHSNNLSFALLSHPLPAFPFAATASSARDARVLRAYAHNCLAMATTMLRGRLGVVQGRQRALQCRAIALPKQLKPVRSTTALTAYALGPEGLHRPIHEELVSTGASGGTGVVGGRARTARSAAHPTPPHMRPGAHTRAALAARRCALSILQRPCCPRSTATSGCAATSTRCALAGRAAAERHIGDGLARPKSQCGGPRLGLVWPTTAGSLPLAACPAALPCPAAWRAHVGSPCRAAPRTQRSRQRVPYRAAAALAPRQRHSTPRGPAPPAPHAPAK